MHSARIVAQTVPSTPTINPGQFIAYVARVSNPSNQESHETAPRLLRYLVRERHWSPFEMAHVVMEIVTTRDIARQILRHRSFSFQEFSQRYADPTAALGFALRDARLQDDRNRQNSIDTDDASLREWWAFVQGQATHTAQYLYSEALKRGIAKEQARALLPEGLTVSRLYMAGSLRSWIHYCELRMGNGTQAEHRAVARSAWEAIVNLYPDFEDALTLEAEPQPEPTTYGGMTHLHLQTTQQGGASWPTDPEWYAQRTAVEVAEVMGVTRQRVYKYAKRHGYKLRGRS